MKMIFCLLATIGLNASPYAEYAPNQKIGVQNAILAKVNGKTISMMDVKKKMDLVFHQYYPQLIHSSPARFQFYETSWRQVLREMIDQELIISDALDKEIKLTDGDVREVMEERYGPNTMQTLDKIGVTYDEAWSMVKNELIVQRMNWWFIQQKAMTNVTPQDIRQAYRLYLQENPASSEWKYQVISIRSDEANDETAEQIYDSLAKADASELKETCKKLETEEISISVSSEFIAKTQDLSDLHRASLETLIPGDYSRPALQISRADNKKVYRIFYLKDKIDQPAPTFEAMAPQLRGELTQKAVVAESQNYLSKLRKHYGFDGEAIPDDLHPFSLQ